jgi:menaquinone-dependent protoporphyrinogen oxidase
VEGQTVKIINYIKRSMEGDVALYNIDLNPSIDFTQFDKVLIGGSIRYGNFRTNLIDFINANKKQLDSLPNAFFLVCLTARQLEKSEPSNNAYMLKFDKLSQWQPRLKGVFAGALLYSRYNWWQTLIIQFIMKITGGSSDKSQDIELTNWSRVDTFTSKFLAL